LANVATTTRIEVIRDWRGASAYAAKYLVKVDDTGHVPCGRVWGLRKPKYLPFGPVQTVILKTKQAFQLARWLRRAVKHEGVKKQLRKTLSFQVFGRGSDWLHAAQALSTMSDNVYYVSFIKPHLLTAQRYAEFVDKATRF
jgi:hypothetical protein